MTHQFPLMDEAQKFFNNQEPTVLKDLFPQGQNTTSISNVAMENFSAPPDKNYINMVQYSTLLQTRNNNYESKDPECKIEHIDMWTNTQLRRQIRQFYLEMKNETVQKWVTTVNAFINQK